MAINGTNLYVAAGDSGLSIFDISDPRGPRVLGRAGVGVFVTYAGVAIQGRFAYVIARRLRPTTMDYVGSLDVFDVAEPSMPKLMGSYASCYTTSIAVCNNYAYLCDNCGVRILDISNPTNIFYVAGLPVLGGSIALRGNYAYHASDTLTVLDIHDPNHPQFLGASGPTGTGNGITLAGDYAYVADGDKGAHIVDISDPLNPQRIGGFDTRGSALGIAVAGNRAFVADGAVGLTVLDIRKTAVPQRLATANTGDGALAVAIQNDLAFVIDSRLGFEIFDVGNPASPQLRARYPTNTPVHDVAVLGNRAYLSSRTGFDIVDIQDPVTPRFISRFTLTTTNGFSYLSSISVQANFAYLIDYYSGLHVVDISNPTAPYRVGGVITPVSARKIAVRGNFAYIANGYNGLWIIDIVNPANPKLSGSCKTTGDSQDVIVSGDYAYLVDRVGVQVIEIRNPAVPVRVGGYSISSETYGVAMHSNYLYVATRYAGIEVFDVRDPPQPRRVGGNKAFESIRLAVSAKGVFVASPTIEGLIALDVYQPLVLMSFARSSSGPFRFSARGTRGMSVQIQRSTNLQDWADWGSEVNFGSQPAIEFTDSDAANDHMSFYRASYR